MNNMTRYTMRNRSQGALYIHRATARPAEKDVHRWVFAHGMDPAVEFTVRKWLSQRLNGFYCDLQVMYTPHLRLRLRSAVQARTHIVLLGSPPLHAMAKGVVVDAHSLNARDTVKALMKATGLNPHMSVCGWPFCLNDLGDAHTGGGAV